ncbi:hypothetical protein ACFX15_023725 [Malus domestica]
MLSQSPEPGRFRRLRLPRAIARPPALEYRTADRSHCRFDSVSSESGSFALPIQLSPSSLISPSATPSSRKLSPPVALPYTTSIP